MVREQSIQSILINVEPELASFYRYDDTCGSGSMSAVLD